MKTNMLSFDSKIKKEDAANVAVQASVPSKVQSNVGMKALMFQGMQNLMANPKLARETGVMNDEPKPETEPAKSYVAPYSSNIAFQGKMINAKTMLPIASMLSLAMASCTSKTEINTKVTQIVDMDPVVQAINMLRSDLADYNISETQRDNDAYKAVLEAINGLSEIQLSIQAQTCTIKSFREMVEGHMENGEFQRSAILNAIIKLQGITEDSARRIVNTIITLYENGEITFEEAMDKLISQLKITNSKIDDTNSKIDETNDNLNDIKAQLAELNASLAEFKANYDVDITQFQKAIGDLYKLVGKIYVDGKNRTQIEQTINMKMSALLADVQNIKKTAVSIRNKIDQGVAIDYDKLEEMFKILNMHQQASKDEILAKLDAYIAGQEKIEAAIKQLDLNNDARATYLANLIKNKTTDNADVIEAINNLAAANETNIAAATEELAAKLDALIARADVGLGKMDGLAKVIQNQGDKIYNKLDVDNQKILDAIKDNGKELRDANGKLDLNNLTLAELKAEAEKIKPELEKLNANAKDANDNLVKIDEDILALKQAIAELEAIAGGALTKDELEELWKAHDANAFAKIKAFLNTIHAEDMDKADEIIEYLKQGNKTAGDTYELLLDFANKANLKADDLKKLLQAVYDYLPELICKCQCSGDCGDNQHTHEGIIGVLAYTNTIIDSMLNNEVFMAKAENRELVKKFIKEADNMVIDNATLSGPVKGSINYDFYKPMLG